jgi:microcystin-dependent protein
MSNPYVGEIRMFAGNFAPAGWNFCDGSLLPISEYSTLFNLIGTTFGGDGQSTFAVPDLRGRIPIHMGTGPGLSTRVIGELAGSETVTLIASQIPIHSHAPQGSSDAGTQTSPGGAVWASSGQARYSTTNPPAAAMNAQNVGQTGGNQPHENMMPFLTVTFIISLFGIFPSQ